ncbi:VUT family protein [Trinickia terrae]|uniref:VUT family protein n=1 Tax=Trinickia terrae TaxID=2571161 RepID=UPI0021078F27|nr:VUT family protein [Trinickia terrae]
MLFPATYAFSTILTEVYGFHVSRLAIWGGLVANSLVVLGVWLVSLLPTSPTHAGIGAQAYEALFSGYVRAFVASSIAYFCILFWGVLSAKEILMIVVKFLYELVLLPLVMRAARYLKQRDEIDYYDVNTRFNPFSLAE